MRRADRLSIWPLKRMYPPSAWRTGRQLFAARCVLAVEANTPFPMMTAPAQPPVPIPSDAEMRSVGGGEPTPQRKCKAITPVHDCERECRIYCDADPDLSRSRMAQDLLGLGPSGRVFEDALCTLAIPPSDRSTGDVHAFLPAVSEGNAFFSRAIWINPIVSSSIGVLLPQNQSICNR